ncbi:patatin-like phospholipase family protein [Streptomyces sp. VRA16 Mangrove soil]|uniref:patatin-like phospholipase family protein n=1 Tax=Streptomyces sp. VRA16 Mangrove soil TaxID=2817434 RepID=UPI001A9F7E12|nr:patatin-like phospholipase family protein [Streptomyces sp. VRA16 Mangrove soil]MBO1337259.1 patatin-like phospholipase family protein [Streptomyces sp. VRA16 Mangrove soil]
MADRALVLGGGGLAGIGWISGILHGLAGAGADLWDADTVIGTSAGAVVGAQLTSGKLTPTTLYERQLAAPAGELTGHLGSAATFRYARAALSSRTIESYGRKLGRMALAARTPDEAARRAVIAGRLLSHDWPERRLLVTAVQAHTGEFRVFEGACGVGLVDAVAASCAVPGVWPPVTLDGARWIDGGTRSPANAHLAAGHDRVVVIAPIAAGGGVLHAARTQAARLADAGARVTLITPDRAARTAFGRNGLDPARRAPAARAGFAQAAAHAAEVARTW